MPDYFLKNIKLPKGVTLPKFKKKRRKRAPKGPAIDAPAGTIFTVPLDDLGPDSVLPRPPGSAIVVARQVTDRPKYQLLLMYGFPFTPEVLREDPLAYLRPPTATGFVWTADIPKSRWVRWPEPYAHEVPFPKFRIADPHGYWRHYEVDPITVAITGQQYRIKRAEAEGRASPSMMGPDGFAFDIARNAQNGWTWGWPLERLCKSLWPE